MPSGHFLSLPLHDPIAIFLVIVACALLVPALARRFGFPEIVGLIAVGVALGPFSLGVLERDRVIELFASVGILFLMFIAGLEIDGNDFRRYRSRSFLFGFLTFAVPMGIGIAAGLLVLRFDVAQSILLASLFASHTLLAYPVASRLRITGDDAVGVTVGGTIITDVAALLVLAVIAGARRGEFGAETALRMSLAFAAFTAFELFVLPRAAAWAYGKLARHEDLEFLFSLAVLFLSALLAELAGVEPIIGAFLAGMAVGRHIPPVSPLANRLEFFGNAVFVPAFLLSVGMLVNPRVLVTDLESLAVAALMTCCVIVSKWLAAFLIQKLSRWSRARRGVVFGLSVPQAAATLAAVLVAYDLGIFGAAVLNGTIVMILVTVLVGSASVQTAGRKLAAERAASAGPDPAGRRLLLGVGDPESASRLLDLAMTLRGDGTLKAVSIVPAVSSDPKAVAEAERNLSVVADRGVAAGLGVATAYRADIDVATGLGYAAAEFRATEIVIGWRTRKSFLDSGMRRVLDQLLPGGGPRVFAARLSAPPGTAARMVLILAPGAEAEPDFEGCVLALAGIARQLKVAPRVFGTGAGLEAARSALEGHPLGSSIQFSDMEARVGLRALDARRDERAMVALVAPRAGNRALEPLLGELDGRLKTLDAILVFPCGTGAQARNSGKRSAWRGFLARIVRGAG
ncbi:MAG: cation:proton antiporter [Spirochaetales bacterium]|nr:cation:proton antiporter [Spirochaetales bacterium]